MLPSCQSTVDDYDNAVIIVPNAAVVAQTVIALNVLLVNIMDYAILHVQITVQVDIYKVLKTFLVTFLIFKFTTETVNF